MKSAKYSISPSPCTQGEGRGEGSYADRKALTRYHPAISAALGFLLLFITGCASAPSPTTQPSGDIYDRQDKMLKDPMNYSLDMDKPDISGGGLGSYDPKAMKKDMDDVLNP